MNDQLKNMVEVSCQICDKPIEILNHVMTYEESLRDVKNEIVTNLGNCPVPYLLLILQEK